MMKLVAIFAAATTLCLAADPFVGTWKPSDVDKWKIGPAGNTGEAKSRIVTVESVGGNYRLTFADLDGKPRADLPILKIYDGKPHPRGVGTVKGEVIDDRHHRETYTGPKGTVVEDYTISADGKTETEIRKGVGINSGREVDEFLTWTRQP